MQPLTSTIFVTVLLLWEVALAKSPVPETVEDTSEVTGILSGNMISILQEPEMGIGNLNVKTRLFYSSTMPGSVAGDT